jgi:hypothetical protein
MQYFGTSFTGFRVTLVLVVGNALRLRLVHRVQCMHCMMRVLSSALAMHTNMMRVAVVA